APWGSVPRSGSAVCRRSTIAVCRRPRPGSWPASPCPPPAAPAGSVSFALAPKTRPLHQPLILLRDQVALDLGHRIEGNGHHDQERCAAEELADVELAPQNFRNETDDRHIGSPDSSDAC